MVYLLLMFFQSTAPSLSTIVERLALRFRPACWSLSAVSNGIIFCVCICKHTLIFCHVGPVCRAPSAHLWRLRKQTVGGDIFLRKTATSFFEHTAGIPRSSKITHAALNMKKKNGFLSFCCCFDVCSDFEVVYWHDALWLLISVKTVWCIYLERITRNDRII